MSEALKSAVPIGSLASARIFPQQTRKPDTQISVGWKKAALQGASRSLISAAERFAEGEGRKDGFIEDVLKIRATGWRVVRMSPVDGQAQDNALKVYYGFKKGTFFVFWVMVAGSDYYDPGVGYLSASSTGELIFSRDAKFADKKDRMMRVRLEKEGIFSVRSLDLENTLRINSLNLKFNYVKRGIHYMMRNCIMRYYIS